ncbi:MAG: hypothetical protein R3C18_27850 [Planctomycetaceae bacterium]
MTQCNCKCQIEHLLATAKLAEESVANRRTYEWHVNLGVAGAIGFLTFKIAGTEVPCILIWSLFFGYLASIVTYSKWTEAVQRGHTYDRNVKNRAMDEVQKQLGIVVDEEPTEREAWKRFMCGLHGADDVGVIGCHLDNATSIK